MSDELSEVERKAMLRAEDPANFPEATSDVEAGFCAGRDYFAEAVWIEAFDASEARKERDESEERERALRATLETIRRVAQDSLGMGAFEVTLGLIRDHANRTLATSPQSDHEQEPTDPTFPGVLSAGLEVDPQGGDADATERTCHMDAFCVLPDGHEGQHSSVRPSGHLQEDEREWKLCGSQLRPALLGRNGKNAANAVGKGIKVTRTMSGEPLNLAPRAHITLAGGHVQKGTASGNRPKKRGSST